MIDNRLEIILASKDVSKKGFDSIQARILKLSKSVVSLNSVLVGLAGASGMGFLIKQALDATAELERNATMAGVGVEAYQELSYAAGQYMITQDALTDGFKELSLRTEEFVITGGGSAKDALQRLGYTQSDLNEKLKDTPALFRDIVRRMEDLDKAAQIRIADELFGGQGGEQFVALIQGGAKALDGFTREARDLGVVMGEGIVKQSKEAKVKIESMMKVLNAQFSIIIAELAPDLTEIASGMAGWVKANRTFLTQDIPGHISNIYNSVKEFVESPAFRAMSWVVSALTADGKGIFSGMGENFYKGVLQAQGTYYGTIDRNTPGYGDYKKGNNDKPLQVEVINTGKDIVSHYPGDIVDAVWADRIKKEYETLTKVQNNLSGLLSSPFTNKDMITPLPDNYYDTPEYIDSWHKQKQEIDELNAAFDDFMSDIDYSGHFEGYRASFLDTHDVIENGLYSLEDAMVGWISTGKLEWKDLANTIISDIARMTTQKGITGTLSNWIGTLFNAHGNAFDGSGVVPFAHGGAFSNSIVTSPTFFKFATGGSFGNLGVMGERTPEVVAPLYRGTGGDMGVKSVPSNLNMTVNIENKAGAQVTASQPTWDNATKQYVWSIVIDGLNGESPSLMRQVASVGGGR